MGDLDEDANCEERVDDDYEGGWHVDRDDDTPENWSCGRCATVNPWRSALCNGCGLPKEASTWSQELLIKLMISSRI